MYICTYQIDVVYACVMGVVGVLVKVFKKQCQLKFKENGFCLVFGVGKKQNK